MEATLQDIANELNLSPTTISRSLRHDKAINPETRARVNEVARRMGYKGRLGRPRRVAEQSAQSPVLGLLVRHRSLDQMQHDTNLMKMMAGIMTVTDEHAMHLKVHTPQEGEQPAIPEGAFQALIAHGEQVERDLDFLLHRLPLVSMGRLYPDLPLDAAVADNVEGVCTLVGHLVELGHRCLAWVGFGYAVTFMEAREAGFMKGCRKHGLEFDRDSFLSPKLRVERDWAGHHIQGKEAILAAVKSGVTGLVCGNDGIALGVMSLLEEAGVNVPAEVSVTGFDAAYPSHPGSRRQPTTVDPNFFEIGKAAARLALQRMAHPRDEPITVSVRGKVVIGDSTAPAPR